MDNQQWRTLSAWHDLVKAAARYVLESGPTVVNGECVPVTRAKMIRVALLLHGMSGVEIARNLGVSRQNVSQVVAGTNRTRRVEEYIAEVIGIPVEELFGPPGIKGRPRRSVGTKPTRRSRRVNAEDSAGRGQAEDEVERARRLVG